MADPKNAISRLTGDWRRSLALLAAVTLLLMTYRLDGTPFRGLYDDVNRSFIARNMVDSGNWLVADYFYGPLYTKPPLMYWTAATIGVLTGRSDELPGNLSSVLGMFAVVLATFWAGRNLFGNRTGLRAGLLLVTMYLFLAMSRQALLDTVMMGGFALTFGSLIHLRFAGPERTTRWWLLVCLGLAISLLTKGPVILPVFLLVWLPLIPGAAAMRPTPRQTLLGLVLIAAITLPWPIALLRVAPEAQEVWKSELFGRFGDGKQFLEWTQKPVWFYLPDLANTMPWLPLLLWSVAVGFRRRGEAAFRLLLVWAVGGLVFYSLTSATKRSYYLLPLYPAFALLVAGAWQDLLDRTGAGVRIPIRARILPLLGPGLVGLMGLAFAGLPFFYPLVPRVPFVAAGVLAAALGLLGLVQAARGRWPRALHLALGGAALVHLAYFGHFVPIANTYYSGKPFFEEAIPLIGDEEVVLLEGQLALSAFYLHRVPYRYAPRRNFARVMAERPGSLVIAPPDRAAAFPELQPVLVREFSEPLGKKKGLGLYRHRPSQPDPSTAGVSPAE